MTRVSEEKITREAHSRLWDENARLRKELLDAQCMIAKLTGGKLFASNATVQVSKLDVPASGKQPIIIGIVQCPKCGQMMEVEK